MSHGGQPAEVVLYKTAHNGFHKTVTAGLREGALEISSYAFDTEGYDREFDLRVESNDIHAMLAALGLPVLQRSSLLTTLQSRFSTLSADADIARFLGDAGIATTGSSYTRMP